MKPDHLQMEQDHADAGEEKLRRMLERAGFHNYSQEHEIDLGMTLGSMRSTFFFEDPNGHYEGICVCLGESRLLNCARVVAELRRRFFEVIEIRSNDLSDIEAMREHFFRLGRALFGRDPAALVRDDRSWFAAPDLTAIGGAVTASPIGVPNDRTVSVDAWPECMDLLDPRWRVLAQALQGAGIPSPTDVDWEIPVGGRVADRRAVMVWQEADDYIALVADKATTPAQIAVSPGSDAAALAEILRQKLLAPR
jgi:hypothetical protein